MTTTSPRERMLAGLPATTRTIDVHGVSTAVLEAGGDGPGLLLLHGGIECGGAMWAPVLARLARHCRVVVPDMPGLGESAPVPDLDVTAFGEWLTGVTSSLASRVRQSLPTRSSALSRPGSPRAALAQWDDSSCTAHRASVRTACRLVSDTWPSGSRSAPVLATPSVSIASPFSISTRHAWTRPRVVRRLRRVHAVPRPRARHQEDDAPAHRDRRQAHPGDRARPHRHSHHLVVGTPRQDGPALDRRSRRITPWLAFARHRRRSPRPPHRTTRGVRGDAHRHDVCVLSCHAQIARERNQSDAFRTRRPSFVAIPMTLLSRLVIELRVPAGRCRGNRRSGRGAAAAGRAARHAP